MYNSVHPTRSRRTRNAIKERELSLERVYNSSNFYCPGACRLRATYVLILGEPWGSEGCGGEAQIQACRVSQKPLDPWRINRPRQTWHQAHKLSQLKLHRQLPRNTTASDPACMAIKASTISSITMMTNRTLTFTSMVTMHDHSRASSSTASHNLVK